MLGIAAAHVLGDVAPAARPEARKILRRLDGPPGVLAAVPTAREQGYDIVWPVIRGVWMGPGVPDADYRRWVDAFARAQATPEFTQLRTATGLYPFSLTGDALTRWVKQAVLDYNRQAREFNLVREH
jgi:putative tricarboxylic transport membrane protein